MKPPPPIRCDVHLATGEPNVYDLWCRLGEEPTAVEVEAAATDMSRRLAEELGKRGDSLSAPATLVNWKPQKAWILHLYAVGQYPAKEK
jgi:hypothetical protein